MKIYISLPITGCDIEVQRSIAREQARFVGAIGHEAVNPFEVETAPRHYDDREQYAHFMGRDIEKLLLADAVLFCPGWEKSRGCRLERQAAHIYGIRCFFSPGQLLASTKLPAPGECRHCDEEVPWDHSCGCTGSGCRLLFRRFCPDFAPKEKKGTIPNPSPLR